MDDHPPAPPALAVDDIRALIQWLEANAEWLRRDHATAARHGHTIPVEAASLVRLYEDTALLFREAYEAQLGNG